MYDSFGREVVFHNETIKIIQDLDHSSYLDFPNWIVHKPQETGLPTTEGDKIPVRWGPQDPY